MSRAVIKNLSGDEMLVWDGFTLSATGRPGNSMRAKRVTIHLSITTQELLDFAKQAASRSEEASDGE